MFDERVFFIINKASWVNSAWRVIAYVLCDEISMRKLSPLVFWEQPEMDGVGCY